MILAASPGGTTANLFSHLAHGDVALNITLTAVSSVLSVFSMPIIVNYALDAFMGGGQIGLQFGKILEVFVIILVKLDRRQAVAIGMEIGIHNCALAIYIAATILKNPLMSVAPAMYSLVMYVTAAGFGWWVNQRHRAELTSAAAS